MTNTTASGGANRPRPSGVEHAVKFRTTVARRRCNSEVCPHRGVIPAGTKYARVIRDEKIDTFHPRCYDYEFGVNDAELAG